MAISKDLVRAVKINRLVPFVGAGVSMGVKPGLFPSWKGLIETLAAQIDEDESAAADAQRVRHLRDGGDYPQAAEVAYQKLGAFRFNRALRDAFRVRRPTDGDLAVAAGIWALRPPLVITTNYDDVLRWACPLDVAVVGNDQAEELALLDDDKTSDTPWLWHLHGTVQRLGTVILAGADYKRLYGDGNQRAKDYEGAVFRLLQTLAGVPLLYVGFSLSDPYVLQQIKHVLELTRGKGAPSYALMKKGEGDGGALWSNYNIQLVEYADHGRPLAELLQEIARQAFPPPPDAPGAVAPGGAGLEVMRAVSFAAPAPAPEPPPAVAPPVRYPPIARPSLEDDYLQALRDNRRLLLLGPRRGGARTLARAMAGRFFGPRVTWLSPPNVPGCTAQEYFRALSGEDAVDGFLAMETWLHARARAGGGDHLIVLKHDGGPVDHLTTLGNSLRKLIDEAQTPFFTLVAGSAACACLRFDAPSFSLFSGAFVRHVPPLTVGEVGAALKGAGRDPAPAAEVHGAIGGLPGFLEEVLVGRALDGAAITARLAQSPSVHGVLRMRVSEDDRKELGPRWHARWALTEMLAGRPVRKLGEVEDQLQFPETRLYYDGLVTADESAGGATVFRCEAVRVAAEKAMRAEEGP